MPPPSSHGITLNRPLGLSNQNQGQYPGSLPRTGLGQLRDYSCPPQSRSSLGGRRSSSGVFITSMFGSRFRHLQKLHMDAGLLGLNAVCFPGLPMGTMFRSSLPATPVSTPIHNEVFTQFTEQALRERLCQTPSPHKTYGLRTFTPLDLNLQNVEECSDSSEQPMDVSSPTSPVRDPNAND